MVKRFITFGLGTPLSNIILEIDGISQDIICMACNAYFKSWCGCYTRTEAIDYIQKYGGEIIKSKVDADTIVARWGTSDMKEYLEQERQKEWEK